MQKFKNIAKTVLAVAGMSAFEALIRSKDVSTPEDAVKTLVIGAVGGIYYWLRSPRDEPAPDEPQPEAKQ